MITNTKFSNSPMLINSNDYQSRIYSLNFNHCVVSLSKNINPSLVLVQPRKTRPDIAERLLMGRKESDKKRTTKENLNIKIRFKAFNFV